MPSSSSSGTQHASATSREVINDELRDVRNLDGHRYAHRRFDCRAAGHRDLEADKSHAALSCDRDIIAGMRFMRSLAFAVVLIYVAGPLVLDACLASCVGLPHSTAPGAPACHHHAASGASAHLATPSRPCGHDHGSHDAALSGVGSAARALRTAGDSGFGTWNSPEFFRAANSLTGPPLLSNPQSPIPSPYSGPIPLRI